MRSFREAEQVEAGAEGRQKVLELDQVGTVDLFRPGA